MAGFIMVTKTGGVINKLTQQRKTPLTPAGAASHSSFHILHIPFIFLSNPLRVRIDLPVFLRAIVDLPVSLCVLSDLPVSVSL